MANVKGLVERTKDGAEFCRIPPTTPGSRPGSLKAPAGAYPSQMTVHRIGPDVYDERQTSDLDTIQPPGEGEFNWINVNGLANVDLIAELGQRFGLHPLALEDAVNTFQRPKTEDYEDVLFIVLRMPTTLGGGPRERGRRLRTQQFAVFLGKDFLVSIHEYPGECLEPVRVRLREGGGRIRRSGPDYIAYALVDAIVDSYFPGMEGYSEMLDDMEDRVSRNAAHHTLGRIHVLRRDLHGLRKTIWKTRDAINFILRDDTPLVDDETRFYLRDCYDHTIQLVDIVESFREMCSDLRDFHMAIVGQRANDVMKFLTIMATIFIPLNFVAALYGMNFEWMPELKWPWGYPYALGLMFTIAGGMLYVFHWRGWLRGGE